MLKPLAAARRLKRLNVVSAILVNDNLGGREWVCHTKSGKIFHLVYLGGVLQASNVVDREYDLELNSKPIATKELDGMIDSLLGFSAKKDRDNVTFNDIINLMGWKMDADQWID